MYLHDINNIKKHNTILLNHWISEIIIKTTFNNILKDGVTSAFTYPKKKMKFINDYVFRLLLLREAFFVIYF
jgi:hypothetical protein